MATSVVHFTIWFDPDSSCSNIHREDNQTRSPWQLTCHATSDMPSVLYLGVGLSRLQLSEKSSGVAPTLAKRSSITGAQRGVPFKLFDQHELPRLKARWSTSSVVAGLQLRPKNTAASVELGVRHLCLPLPAPPFSLLNRRTESKQPAMNATQPRSNIHVKEDRIDAKAGLKEFRRPLIQSQWNCGLLGGLQADILTQHRCHRLIGTLHLCGHDCFCAQCRKSSLHPIC